MPHSFTIDLDETEIAAFAERFNYQSFVPDPSGRGSPQQRKPVPNPVSPFLFAQQAIEAFIERIADEHVGTEAARTAQQQAVIAHRAHHPRRRERR